MLYGKEIIAANYKNIVLPNPEKDLFVCYNENDDAEILNAKGEKIFTEYEEVKPIKLKNVASTLSYEKSILAYKKDGLYGIIDFAGKVLTKNLYDSIENLQPTEGKMLVSKDGKYGVIDINGNEIIPVNYDKIISDEYYTEKDQYKKSGFIVSNKTDDGYKYGYISYNGKKILDTKYNEIERISKEDPKNVYLIVSENGKKGLYRNSKNIIENEYQSINYEDDDILTLQKNKKYGIANLDGKIIIKPEKEEIECRGIYIYTKSSGENKVYNHNGDVVDINYNKTVYNTENTEYKITTVLNNDITYYGIQDKNGNKLVDETYRYVEYLYNNYFIVKDELGNLGVINSNGKSIVETKYSSLQKVKGKNIVQAVENDYTTNVFYSADMKEVLSAKKPNIHVQDDYIVILDGENKVYLDNDGNKLSDISSLKNADYPDSIGDYKKEQVSVENVYYIKNSK